MKIYDIIHVEDDVIWRDHVEFNADLEGLTYLSVTSKEALEECLSSSTAKVFVVDGKFPRVERGYPEPLTEEAIKLIRSYSVDSQIIINSANCHYELSEKYGVLEVGKGEGSALITKIKGMISE